MKTFLLVAFILVFVTACEDAPKAPTVPSEVSQTTTVAPSETQAPHQDSPAPKLAWSKEPNGTAWTKIVYDAIDSLGNVNAKGLKTPCKKLDTRDCAAQLLSIIAKRESNYKTETKYNETGHLQGVVSRGLFQISKDSANQSAYGCGIASYEQLHNAEINIRCAVKILAYQAAKTGTLIDGAKGGCGAYWSVCRNKSGSGSYEEIMKYMSQF